MRRVCTATRLGRAAAARCTPTGRRLITGIVIIAAAMAARCVYQVLSVWDKSRGVQPVAGTFTSETR